MKNIWKMIRNKFKPQLTLGIIFMLIFISLNACGFLFYNKLPIHNKNLSDDLSEKNLIENNRNEHIWKDQLNLFDNRSNLIARIHYMISFNNPMQEDIEFPIYFHFYVEIASYGLLFDRLLFNSLKINHLRIKAFNINNESTNSTEIENEFLNEKLIPEKTEKFIEFVEKPSNWEGSEIKELWIFIGNMSLITHKKEFDIQKQNNDKEIMIQFRNQDFQNEESYREGNYENLISNFSQISQKLRNENNWFLSVLILLIVGFLCFIFPRFLLYFRNIQFEEYFQLKDIGNVKETIDKFEKVARVTTSVYFIALLLFFFTIFSYFYGWIWIGSFYLENYMFWGGTYFCILIFVIYLGLLLIKKSYMIKIKQESENKEKMLEIVNMIEKIYNIPMQDAITIMALVLALIMFLIGKRTFPF